MGDVRLEVLALVVTLWLLLMVLLQAAINRRVWNPYRWMLLAAGLATVLLWPDLGTVTCRG